MNQYSKSVQAPTPLPQPPKNWDYSTFSNKIARDVPGMKFDWNTSLGRIVKPHLKDKASETIVPSQSVPCPSRGPSRIHPEVYRQRETISSPSLSPKLNIPLSVPVQSSKPKVPNDRKVKKVLNLFKSSIINSYEANFSLAIQKLI